MWREIFIDRAYHQGGGSHLPALWRMTDLFGQTGRLVDGCYENCLRINFRDDRMFKTVALTEWSVTYRLIALTAFNNRVGYLFLLCLTSTRPDPRFEFSDIIDKAAFGPHAELEKVQTSLLSTSL